MTDYTELVKALRVRSRNLCPGDICDICEEIHFLCSDKVMHDAADAIEALQAQLPKRGEWIVRGANRVDCSVCGHSICFAFGLSEGSLTGYNYCPNCGAKMEEDQE